MNNNKRRTVTALISLGATMVLAACAMGGDAGKKPATPAADSAQTLRVSGTVAWRERMAVPPDTEVIVRLQDVSRMDARAITLAEQRISVAGKQPPYAFELSVDAARIDPRKSYAVFARVESKGRLLFINNTAYPVLTRGNGPTAQLMLVRAGSR